MTTTTRARPRSLPSATTKLSTEIVLGKGGSFQHGVTELACRLISLHLRRGTVMTSAGAGDAALLQPSAGRRSAVLGIGDGIAHVLKQHLKAKEDVKEAEAARAA